MLKQKFTPRGYHATLIWPISDDKSHAKVIAPLLLEVCQTSVRILRLHQVAG